MKVLHFDLCNRNLFKIKTANAFAQIRSQGSFLIPIYFMTRQRGRRRSHKIIENARNLGKR